MGFFAEIVKDEITFPSRQQPPKTKIVRKKKKAYFDY